MRLKLSRKFLGFMRYHVIYRPGLQPCGGGYDLMRSIVPVVAVGLDPEPQEFISKRNTFFLWLHILSRHAI